MATSCWAMQTDKLLIKEKVHSKNLLKVDLDPRARSKCCTCDNFIPHPVKLPPHAMRVGLGHPKIAWNLHLDSSL